MLEVILADQVGVIVVVIGSVGDRRAAEVAIGFLGEVGVADAHLTARKRGVVQFGAVAAFRGDDRPLGDLARQATGVVGDRIFVLVVGLAIEVVVGRRPMAVDEVSEPTEQVGGPLPVWAVREERPAGRTTTRMQPEDSAKSRPSNMALIPRKLEYFSAGCPL